MILGISSVVCGVIAVFAIFLLTKYGETFRESLLSWIPLPTKFLLVLIILVFGLMAGGFGAAWHASAGALSTASLGINTDDVIQDTTAPSVQQSVTGEIASVNLDVNMTGEYNKGSRTQYDITLTNVTGAGDGYVNGTITLERAASGTFGEVDCYAYGDEYGNQINPDTDSNIYSILARPTTNPTNKLSMVTSLYAQSIYLNNGAIATTSSNIQETTVTFDRTDKTRTLGFYFVLPGDTVFNYLDDTDDANVHVVCGGQEIAVFNIEKKAA
ncbi:MAG: hypothetical protein OEL87_00110 [Nanoarchaeota archaeon]|nr:hypothetical protein [Nanoarchaeota archaeon]